MALYVTGVVVAVHKRPVCLRIMQVKQNGFVEQVLLSVSNVAPKSLKRLLVFGKCVPEKSHQSESVGVPSAILKSVFPEGNQVLVFARNLKTQVGVLSIILKSMFQEGIKVLVFARNLKTQVGVPLNSRVLHHFLLIAVFLGHILAFTLYFFSLVSRPFRSRDGYVPSA